MDKKVLDLFEKLNNEIIKYNPHYDKALIEKAFLYSNKAHAGIFRKSGDPFVIHPLSAAVNLTRIEADELSILGALLHDVCDNPEYTIEKVEESFGKEVASIVSGVYKLGELYYKTDMSKDEVDDLRKSLLHVGNDIRIFLVKIADRLHNLETLEFLEKTKRYRIAKETEEIYIPMVNFLSIGEFVSEFHDLCFKYENEKEYKRLYKIFGKKQAYYEETIIGANNLIERELKKLNIEFKITSRIKSLYSIHKKMKNKNLDFSEISDILALRVITKNINDCYLILGVIHKMFKIKSDKFKDYISLPKDNGYQSIHTTVYDNNSNLIEFQIQTFEMNKLNKSGIAAHFIYKGFGVEYVNMPTWMKGVLDVQKKSIDAKGFLEKLKDEIIASDIKCLSVDGKMITLPKGSVLIDFAFEISPESGMYFESANINGVLIKDPFHELKDGDFVRINKSPKINIDYKVESIISVKTQKARDNLKNIFNKFSKTKTEALGKFLLNNDLEIYSYRYFENLPGKIKYRTLKNFGVKDDKQLYLFIGLGIIESRKVFDYISEFFDKKDFSKEISLKIFTKTSDFTTINNITNIFYNLNININKLSFREKNNSIFLNVSIEKKEDLDELLGELKRAPNVLSVRRIFSTRLKVYYLLFFTSIIILATLTLIINMIDLTEKRTLLIKGVFFGSILFMIFILSFLKYIVNRMIPDVLRYKRFWFSIFFLNTVILLIVFWELYYLGFYFDSFLYFIFAFAMYGALIIQYLKYRNKVNYQKNPIIK